MSTANTELSTDTIAPDFASCLTQGKFEFWITSPTGIAIAPEIPEHKWKTLTENVAFMFEATGKKHSQAAMMLGDLLAFGEDRFPDYANVVDSTREYMRVQMKTLINWSYISKKIDPSRRRENLSLSHHEAVMKLPADEQNEYLRLADNEGLSVSELKKKIAEAHPGKPRSEKPVVKVKIDTDDASAVLDAMNIVAKWLTENQDEVTDDWQEPMHTIAKEFRRRYQNGHKKPEPQSEPAATEGAA